MALFWRKSIEIIIVFVRVGNVFTFFFLAVVRSTEGFDEVAIDRTFFGLHLRRLMLGSSQEILDLAEFAGPERTSVLLHLSVKCAPTPDLAEYAGAKTELRLAACPQKNALFFLTW